MSQIKKRGTKSCRKDNLTKIRTYQTDRKRVFFFLYFVSRPLGFMEGLLILKRTTVKREVGGLTQ